MLDRRARYGEAMFSIYPPDAMEDVSEIQVMKQDDEPFDVEAVNPCDGTAWMSDPAPLPGRLSL